MEKNLEDSSARSQGPSEQESPGRPSATVTPTQPGSVALSFAPGRARYDQVAYNFTPSQGATSTSGTSYYRSKRKGGAWSRDPDKDDGKTDITATTDASFYSYHSSRDLAAFVREMDGRMFNNQNELYMLPSDNQEFQRLQKQHYAFVLSEGGLTPCQHIVESILRPSDEGEPRSVLDLGCGSGIWAIEMAKEYPNASIVALDLAPAPIDLENIPPNCRFEIDDVNLGLSHYHGNSRFDIIHTRCIGSGINNYANMMRDVEACLKPGGLVIFIDGDMRMYEEDGVTPVPVGEEDENGVEIGEGSWLHRIAREVRYAAIYRGSDVPGLEDCIDLGLFGHPLIEPSSIRAASLYTPIGPWPESPYASEQQQLRYAGALMRQDLIQLSRAWHPILKVSGIDQATLDRWSERVDKELLTGKFKMLWHWRTTWGRRKLEDPDGQPIDTTPEDTIQTYDLPDEAPRAYNFFRMFTTAQEAAAFRELRTEKAKHLPLPLVVKMYEEAQSTV
ncbi:hypothetical protein PIIN_01456 [Serendipita indica DSM 11827]|uniref:Methyltransferase domain-containing protein n=1 Tax=Serendipita indica (strain DSM 11827) TaxID=1109443 RepID=G4T8L3_SERID|nr:hypothetical protein PIIN_01456 [Serendipita indica DSM 11827]